MTTSQPDAKPGARIVILSTYVTDCLDCGGDIYVVEDVEQPHDCPRYRYSEEWLEDHPENDPYWWRP